MQLVFTEDIKVPDGRVRFAKGMLRDYTRQVWDQIAKNLGRPLVEFTREPTEGPEVGTVKPRLGATKRARLNA